MVRTISYRGTGPILFEKSDRAKHVSITVRPGRGVRVAVPKRVSYEAAGRVVMKKLPWIRKQVTGIKAMEAEHQAYLKGAGPIDMEKARRVLETARGEVPDETLTEAETLFNDGLEKLHIVEYGNGVHNKKYSLMLMDAALTHFEEIVDLLGAGG